VARHRANQDHADDALGPKRSDDAARAPAPIETAKQRALDTERIHQVVQVVRQHRLLARARRLLRHEPRRSIAA